MRIASTLITLLFAASAHAGPTAPVASQDEMATFITERGLLGRLGEVGTRVEAKASELVFNAMTFLGVPYKRGGTSFETGFDCSGFVRYVFQQAANLTLPHGARAISQLGQTVTQRELKPGDLVFFNTVRSTFSHVGIYIGNNRFIHSPSAGSAISVTDMGDSYWAKRFTGARRLDAKELASLEANGAKSIK